MSNLLLNNIRSSRLKPHDVPQRPFEKFAISQVVDSTDAGGAERIAVQLANAFAGLGLSSHLIVTRHLGALFDQIDPAVHLLVLNRHHTFEYEALHQAIEYIRQWNIRILHAHNRTNAYWCAIWKHFGQLSAHVIFHDNTGDYESAPRWKVRLEENLDRAILRSVSGVISASAPLQNRNVRVFSSLRAPVFLVQNGIDLAIYENIPKHSSERCIVQVGNLRPQKGYLHVADIGAHLNRRLGEFKWLCIGSLADKVYFTMVNRRLAEENLQDKINFLGLRTDVPMLLANATVGVLTSEDEGMPLALLEYMASGLPVVVTDVAECRKIVECAQCGFAVSRGKPAEFAEAIAWLCKNPRQAEMMGRRGQKAAGKYYSVEVMLSRVLDFYSTVLSHTI
jgi:glycosyltransferase involved in cell wall biosynthesis